MEQSKLIKTFIDCIRQHKLIEYGIDKKIVVGCSGGSDSMTLLDCLYRVKDAFGIEIIPVHINHLIREESGNDAERLAAEIKKRYDLKLFVVSSNIKSLSKRWKMSIEECGREVRKIVLTKVAKKTGANKIALGHNLNDQAETLIYRIARGTGFRGLCGMNVMSDSFIRPLLFIEKSDIKAYADENALFYIEDSSNYELCYDRNIIRHNVLPQLSRVNKKAINHLTSLSQICRDLNNFIDEEVKKQCDRFLIAKTQDFIIYSSDILKLNVFICKEVLRALYEQFAGSIHGIDAFHINMFYENAIKKENFRQQFPHDVVIIKSSDIIFVSKKCFDVPPYEFIAKEGLNMLPFCLGSFEIEMVKGDISSVIIRGFRDGDLYNGRKLKKLYNDKGVPQVLRRLLPLVVFDGKVIYTPLCGKKQASFKNSRLTFKINFLESELYSKIINRFLVINQ